MFQLPGRSASDWYKLFIKMSDNLGVELTYAAHLRSIATESKLNLVEQVLSEKSDRYLTIYSRKLHLI